MKFLIFTLTSWDEAPRARHQLTKELLKFGHEVYFVEKNRVGFPKITVNETTGNFTLINTRFIPGYKFRFRLPFINELYQNWLFKRLKARLGDLFVITFDFTAHKLSRYFSNSVYYCNDEVIGNTTVKSTLVDLYWQRCEKAVTANSRLCITTSAYLTCKLFRWNRKVFEIPLGGPDPGSIETPVKVPHGGKVILGLVGFIREMTISVDVINALLEEKSWIIRIIGTVDEKFLSKIDHASELELLGVLKDQALYAAISQFDVAIIPYNLEELNPGATSNKLYLHLACGVPVVMSTMPNLKGKSFPPGSIYLSEDNSDFPVLVKEALKEEKPEYVEMRKKIAAGNTWEMRVNEFIQILKDENLYES